MTDDEIRIKIAKMKGWRVYDPDKYDGHLFGRSPEGVFYSELPGWTGDIGTAMSLLSEVGAWQIGSPNLDDWGDKINGYWCKIYGHDLESSGPEFESSGDSLPHAICLAWLAWKEG